MGNSSNYFKARKVFKEFKIDYIDVTDVSSQADLKNRILDYLESKGQNNTKPEEFHYVYVALNNDYPVLAGEGNFRRISLLASKKKANADGSTSLQKPHAHVKAVVTALWTAHEKYSKNSPEEQEEFDLKKGVGVLLPSHIESGSLKQYGKKVEDALHSAMKVGKSADSRGGTSKNIQTALQYRLRDYRMEFGAEKTKEYFSKQNQYWVDALPHLLNTASEQDFKNAKNIIGIGEKQYPGVIDAFQWLFGDYFDASPNTPKELPSSLLEIFCNIATEEL